MREPARGDEVEAEALLPQPGPLDQLTVDEVKSRAVHGTATLGARSLVTFALGVGGNLVLARLLVPQDFGLVALGATITTVAAFASQAGIGARLIGRTRPPDREELQAVMGFQLAVSVLLVVCVAGAAWPFGRAGLVPALMLTSLPLATLRLPTVLILERQLSYSPIARADVFEAIANFAWAIPTVAAGMGVWGLASAAPVRVLLGTLVLIHLGPLGFVRPTWAWRRVRPILRFGVQFQAMDVVGAIRDQGLNAGVAAVGGFSTLGLWSFAYRIMSVPVALYSSLWRVCYPAMARILDAEEDPRLAIDRTIGVVAVAMSPLLVGIAASAAALLPVIVGERWSGSVSIVVWGCAATMVNAPVSIPCEGYLLAAGHVSKVLLAAVIGAVLWLGLALSLLVPVGAGAIGIGWFVTAFVEAILLGHWVERGTGARVVSSVARPLTAAAAAGGAGLAVSSLGEPRVLLGVGGLVVGELVLLAGLYILARDTLRNTLRLSGRAIATARAM